MKKVGNFLEKHEFLGIAYGIYKNVQVTFGFRDVFLFTYNEGIWIN